MGRDLGQIFKGITPGRVTLRIVVIDKEMGDQWSGLGFILKAETTAVAGWLSVLVKEQMVALGIWPSWTAQWPLAFLDIKLSSSWQVMVQEQLNLMWRCCSSLLADSYRRFSYSPPPWGQHKSI